MNKIDKKVLKKFCDDFWFSPSDILVRAREERIWRDIEFKRPVLDIGCGDARIGKDLFWNKKQFDVGLDADIKEIENAKKLKMYKKLIVADAADMPFRSRSFYSVVSNSTFEHIEDDEEAIKEISRVLRKGGRFYMTTTTDRLRKTFKRNLTPSEYKQINTRLHHLHYRSIDEWKKILEKNNLKIIEYKYYFDDVDIEEWIRLFKITTFNFFNRELWSYLHDPRVSKFLPNNIFSSVIFTFFKKRFRDKIFTEKGNWIYIVAQKQ